MAKRSGFLYEALRARSRGSSSERITRSVVGRSAVGAGRGLFSWLGDRASDATAAVTGRRRRSSSPGVMLIGIAAGILVVGFFLGRWSYSLGGDGTRNLSTTRTPGQILSEEDATSRLDGPGTLLTSFKDRDYERGLDVVRAMAAGRFPTARLLSTANNGNVYHVLVVYGTMSECERLVDQIKTGRLRNPVPDLLDRSDWNLVIKRVRALPRI